MIGKGELTKSIAGGFTRLFTTDFERDCRCEAAGVLTAYLLGLPVFAWRPNALEAGALLFGNEEDDEETKNVDLLTSNGLLRVLVWILSPVAAESLKHPPPLVVSDPRECEKLFDNLISTRDKLPEDDPVSERSE